METNYRPLNGIVLNGKFYEAVIISDNDTSPQCDGCALTNTCARTTNNPCANSFFPINTEGIFRFSKSITDKISSNG